MKMNQIHNNIILFILLFMFTNISYIFLISTLLILGGWAFKAVISLAQGKPVEVNLKNPLNLKARWPKEPKEKK